MRHAGRTGFGLSGFGLEAYNSNGDKLKPVPLDLSGGAL